MALNEGALKGQFRPEFFDFLCATREHILGIERKKENNKFAPRRLGGHIFI